MKGRLSMWYLDVPQHDPDSNYPEPSAKQFLYADQTKTELRQLKTTLEKLRRWMSARC